MLSRNICHHESSELVTFQIRIVLHFQRAYLGYCYKDNVGNGFANKMKKVSFFKGAQNTIEIYPPERVSSF